MLVFDVPSCARFRRRRTAHQFPDLLRYSTYYFLTNMMEKTDISHGLSIENQVFNLSRQELDSLKRQAINDNQDFLCLVASRASGISYDEVDAHTRMRVKSLLFAYLYGRRHPLSG